MKASELREKYISFFEKKGHVRIPSASLLPDNDPTVLFTTAGMHPLVPYLMGQPHPEGKRLVDVQKCIRTGDIDEVGNKTHHTFFEMLGNWSLGDYFKKEAIEYSFEFLTEILKIPLERLSVSVFLGDSDAPRDEFAASIWQALGIPKNHIAYLPKSDNWWGPAGQSGPCGPDSEMFYWSDNSHDAPKTFNPKDKRWVEIWNDVFMEYDKQKDGTYIPLKQRNVDTGMGLERTLACLNNIDDNYRTELFWPIIEKIENISGKKYESSDTITRVMRIIADHMRAATFILGDEKGVIPSNVEAGYVVRKLIRRAVRYGKIIGMKNFTHHLSTIVIDSFKDTYPELERNQDRILEQLIKEEGHFLKTLEKGLKVLEKIDEKNFSGKESFKIFSTYGFPLEMIQEELTKRGLSINENEFKEELKKHQDLSRTAAMGRFKGGLADASKATVELHTATHLLLAALRKVLGDHVFQKGSNITPERLRLDFSHPEKLNPDQKKAIEDLVNEQIKKDLSVESQVMTFAQAKERDAMGVFEHKYGKNVNVYTIGDERNPFSREICGGPHVKKTSELGTFRIKKEEAVSSGIRRIKAVIEKGN